MRLVLMVALVFLLAGCGSMLDLACALRQPSDVEKMGDAINPKVPE